MGRKRNWMSKFLYMFICAFMICIMIFTPVEAVGKAKLNKTKATVTVGKTVKLNVVNNKNKVIWMSMNKKIATVSKSGIVTGKKKGSTKIIAKVGKKKFACKVTVKAAKKAEVNKASLDRTLLGVTKGKSGTIKVLGTNKSISSVSSSNSKIASVKKTGSRTVKVTGKKDGTAYVKIKVGGKTLKCQIQVSNSIDYSGAEQKNKTVGNKVNVSIKTSLTYPEKEKECRGNTDIPSNVLTFDTVTITVRNNYSKNVKVTIAQVANLGNKTGFLNKTAWVKRNSYSYFFGEKLPYYFYHSEMPGNIYGGLVIKPGETKTITYYEHIPKSVYDKETWNYISGRYGQQYLTESYGFFAITPEQTVNVTVTEYPYRQSQFGKIGHVDFIYYPYTEVLKKDMTAFGNIK